MRKKSSSSSISMATTKDKKAEPFTIDSMVEVSREEDEGPNKKRAWYVARLLKKSLPNETPKFLVKYKTLFFKNGPFKRPLTEEITGVSYIRPLPTLPAADQTYELYDVVDAFHRGGWWKGVVSKVEVFEQEKGQSRKYTVVFENPPEKFEFSSENLRFHSVWNDGKWWVRSPKQKRMKGLNFGKGMDVEVNINDEAEISKDAWFPAVVLEEVGFNSFLVEYSRSSNDGPIKKTIDSFQIRPPSPKFDVEEFGVVQCVEAFHDSCWKKGTIMTTLRGGRYNVVLDSVKQEIQFRHSELRPHRIWKYGKWVGFEDYVADSTEHSEVVVSVKSSSTWQDHSREKACRKKMSDERYDANEKSSVKKSRKDPVHIQKDNNNAFGQQDNVFQRTASEVETEACASEKAALSAEKDMENGDVIVSVKSSRAGQDHSREKACRKKMSDAMDDANEKSSVKKSRKDPVPIQEDTDYAFGQQDNVSQGTAGEMETEACVSEKAELSTQKDTENGDVMVRSLSVVPVDVHAANGALSTCFVGDGESAMCQEMPFEKISSFWQHLDALDVFQSLPQKPHFSPLFELNEATREGFAIAHLLNFANVVDRISQLQVETPREVIGSYLEALTDLEVFGFDVKPVIERINRLLSIKTRHEQLDNESKDIYSKIAECDSEKEKIEDEMNTILKMISELKERRAVKLSEKAKQDDEINILQIDARSKTADILNMKLDFERRVAAPW